MFSRFFSYFASVIILICQISCSSILPFSYGENDIRKLQNKAQNDFLKKYEGYVHMVKSKIGDMHFEPNDFFKNDYGQILDYQNDMPSSGLLLKKLCSEAKNIMVNNSQVLLDELVVVCSKLSFENYNPMVKSADKYSSYLEKTAADELINCFYKTLKDKSKPFVDVWNSIFKQYNSLFLNLNNLEKINESSYIPNLEPKDGVYVLSESIVAYWLREMAIIERLYH